MNPVLQFFIGKGGVGKSTTSALAALHYAANGCDTLLVSMDPAHNQRDIFGMNFSETPLAVTPHLAVLEVDTDRWMTRYLKQTEKQVKRAYGYHTAFNLQSCFNVLRFSPGLEEYALLLSFEHVVQTGARRNLVIFDMPPTALSLKFFSLPFVTLLWLEELLKLRRKVYAKKEIVSKIKLGKRQIEQDKVVVKLEELIERHRRLREFFISAGTHINLVVNHDPLSAAEGVRIKERLGELGIHVRRLALNKVRSPAEDGAALKGLNAAGAVCFPLSEDGLFGLEALRGYLEAHRLDLPPV